MKSRITIDLNGQNVPVIRVDYKSSDDVRDKLIRRFTENLGHISNFCLIEFLPIQGEYDFASEIISVTPENMESLKVRLDESIRIYKKYQEESTIELKD